MACILLSALVSTCAASVRPASPPDGAASDVLPVSPLDGATSDAPTTLHTCTGIAQSDTGSLAIAEQTCGRGPRCRTCVQRLGATGEPASYIVYVEDADCFCGLIIDLGATPPLTCATSTTFTIPTRVQADALCAGQADCIVCPESINRSGTPNRGLVMRHAGCSCPTPHMNP